ncbi:hypothetical protein B9Z47_14615 [Limnohabitans sp. 2KL-1]|uniref:Kazal-type serine protease inhibitor family protein n=1 Tax=Limnohabitans sp. 2KL-1 TaxID=1100699 RepID=UPI000D36E803|nr:Kazal-type serine protease inhibitor [Limnohabitans sp. 2KL-1]PUE46130.1 hypothetical protein B9Z47_14615 [Limnohabitans sp. 2KL-1]
MTHTVSFHGTLLALCLALCLALTGTAAMGQLCTREYVPVCGLLPQATDPRTFPNRCVLDAAGARLIEHGVCAAKPAPIIGHDSNGHGCKASAGYQWNKELSGCVRP